MGRLRIFLALLALAAPAQTLAPGKLLVAAAKNRDPDFARAVVLVFYAEHDAVIGILINRPPLAAGTPWRGGPVPVGVNTLIRTTNLPPKAKRLLPDLAIVSEPHEARRLASTPGARLYEGTCGWTLRQLREEIHAGQWRVVDGRASLLLDPKAESLWERLSRP